MDNLMLLADGPLWPALDPPTRAVLLMSLLAFVLLGLGLIAGAMIGGRWVRRIGGDDLTKPLPLRRSESDANDLGQPVSVKAQVPWSADTARIGGAATSETVHG